MAGEIDFRLLDTQAPAKIYQAFQEGLDFKRKRAAEDADLAMKQRAQEMLNQHYATEARRADLEAQQIGIKQQELEAKRRAGKAQADATARALGAMLGVQTDQGWQPAEFRVGDYLGDEDGYQIMPAAMWDDGTPAQGMKTAKSPSAPKPQWQVNPEAANAMGVKPEDAQKLLLLMQDPKLFSYFGRKQIDSMFPKASTQLKPTGELANFMILKESGQLPMNADFNEWHRSNLKSGASNVNVAPVIGTGEALKNRGKEFGKFAQAATEGAQSAYDASQDISMVVQGLRGMGGGPVAEFKAWAGQVFPADSDWGKMASMGELAKTVQTKLAPTLRVAGSGATSDFEMKAYMAAIPTLSTTEKGRELMGKYAQRVADRAQARAEVVNDIEQSGRLPTPKDIAAGMRAKFGDKFFDDEDRAFFGMKGGKAPSAASHAAPASASKYIEIRQTADGRTLGKKADGRIEEIK